MDDPTRKNVVAFVNDKGGKFREFKAGTEHYTLIYNQRGRAVFLVTDQEGRVVGTAELPPSFDQTMPTVEVRTNDKSQKLDGYSLICNQCGSDAKIDINLESYPDPLIVPRFSVGVVCPRCENGYREVRIEDE